MGFLQMSGSSNGDPADPTSTKTDLIRYRYSSESLYNLVSSTAMDPSLINRKVKTGLPGNIIVYIAFLLAVECYSPTPRRVYDRIANRVSAARHPESTRTSRIEPSKLSLTWLEYGVTILHRPSTTFQSHSLVICEY